MSGVLSNFLFGNIDDDGNLEDSSYLTAVSIEYKTFQTYCNVHKVFIVGDLVSEKGSSWTISCEK